MKLSDYQELHRAACDSLLCDDWHHYTDRVPSNLIVAHTAHSAKLLIVPQRHEVCVCERACECLFAPGLMGAEGEG